MRLTVVSVAAQSLTGLVQCYDELAERYGPELLDLKAFYVAQLLAPGKQAAICQAVREADTVLIDLMGAPQELIEAVGDALDRCKGNRIVIGYGCREKTRLGQFSMGAGMRKKQDPGPDSRGAAGMMNGMRRMAQGMRKVLPLPILRDMDNLFLAGDYTQYFFLLGIVSPKRSFLCYKLLAHRSKWTGELNCHQSITSNAHLRSCEIAIRR